MEFTLPLSDIISVASSSILIVLNSPACLVLVVAVALWFVVNRLL
jgi:hypothetical protein